MIVVDVDDPGLGRDLLGDLVSVLGGGQAGADVQELPDPRLLHEVLHRAAQEGPVSLRGGQDVRYSRDDLPSGYPVGLVVVLPPSR